MLKSSIWGAEIGSWSKNEIRIQKMTFKKNLIFGFYANLSCTLVKFLSLDNVALMVMCLSSDCDDGSGGSYISSERWDA